MVEQGRWPRKKELKPGMLGCPEEFSKCIGGKCLATWLFWWLRRPKVLKKRL
jgi:hypothetical protein